MMRLLAPSLAMLVLVAGCSGDGEEATAPAPSGRQVTESPRPATEAAGAGEFWFRGRVQEVDTGCYADGICSVRVEVIETLEGDKPAVGEAADVIFGIGWVGCLGQQDEASKQVGATIEVKAGAYQYDASRLSICGDAGYSLLLAPE